MKKRGKKLNITKTWQQPNKQPQTAFVSNNNGNFDCFCCYYFGRTVNSNIGRGIKQSTPRQPSKGAQQITIITTTNIKTKKNSSDGNKVIFQSDETNCIETLFETRASRTYKYCMYSTQYIYTAHILYIWNTMYVASLLHILHAYNGERIIFAYEKYELLLCKTKTHRIKWNLIVTLFNLKFLGCF